MDEDIAKILRRLLRKTSAAVLAKQIGISETTVIRVAAGFRSLPRSRTMIELWLESQSKQAEVPDAS